MSTETEDTIISTFWVVLGLYLLIDYILLRIHVLSIAQKLERVRNNYDCLKQIKHTVKRDEIIDLRNKLAELLSDARRCN